MYSDIESEFKRRSRYNRDSIFILVLSFCYGGLAIVISMMLDSIWYSYGLMILLIPVIYIYLYLILKKQFKIHDVKFWNLKLNREIYIVERNIRDAKLLAEICKNNHVNTRPKVLVAINHYQVLIPRNIIGTGMFLSIIAIIISIFVFSFDGNNAMSLAKIQSMISLIVLVGILYLIFKYTVDQFASAFGSKALYKRMEGILSSIYFQSLIK